MHQEHFSMRALAWCCRTSEGDLAMLWLLIASRGLGFGLVRGMSYSQHLLHGPGQRWVELIGSKIWYFKDLNSWWILCNISACTYSTSWPSQSALPFPWLSFVCGGWQFFTQNITHNHDLQSSHCAKECPNPWLQSRCVLVPPHSPSLCPSALFSPTLPTIF